MCSQEVTTITELHALTQVACCYVLLSSKMQLHAVLGTHQMNFES